MKKLFAVILALCVSLGSVAFAQEAAKPAKAAKAEKAPKLTNIKGTISADGKSFVNDKDQKSWTIKNPEDVKGHEGHHVVLNAHVYPDTSEVHVMKVTMVAEKAKKASKM
jgi:hypothetical protein